MHALYFDLCNGFVSDDISAPTSERVYLRSYKIFFSITFHVSIHICLNRIKSRSFPLIWLTYNDLHGFELIYLQLLNLRGNL